MKEKRNGESAIKPKKVDKVNIRKTCTTIKLALDIEVTIDIKQVLETRIINSKMKFTLREVLVIAKKEFHDVIIDAFRRKRWVT